MAVFDLDLNGGQAVIRFSGDFDMERATELNQAAHALPRKVKQARDIVLDLGGVKRLEPNCAFILAHLAAALKKEGRTVSFRGLSEDQQILFKAISEKHIDEEEPPQRPPVTLTALVSELGAAAIELGQDSIEILSFLGATMIGLWKVTRYPERLRVLSIVTHIERAGLKAVPIVCLMSFLIGGIVAQQGAFQLKRFGAEVFVVDLIGILVLRELGVLLTAIMFAGRSGSAYTAEIGSMKMREEIDAMRVIGLYPVEVLAIPRLIALIIALPLVTMLSDLSALFGGMLVCWGYVGIDPQSFWSQIQLDIPVRHAFIGVVKAPFMAVIIGVIACIEGLRVAGSTDSLGQHTTSSVVKSIFMVIIVDGIFAVIFAAMDL